jgi:hypothetical protein
MKRFNVVSGEGKVPTGTYTNHSTQYSRYDVSGQLEGVSWHFDGTGDEWMYIDDGISSALQHDTSTKKYAWLMEGRGIIPGVYQDIVDNLDAYMQVFEIIFTSDRSMYELHDRIKFMPANTLWVKDIQMYPKTKLLSMIASNKNWTDGHQLRIQTMRSLHGKADLFGNQINPIAVKEDGLRDYMFSVAIENASYPTYFTEKILDCFATGTIPIYWGTRDIVEHFNPDGIIFLEDFIYEDLGPHMYYSRMDAVKENLELSRKYILLENYMNSEYFS